MGAETKLVDDRERNRRRSCSEMADLAHETRIAMFLLKAKAQSFHRAQGTRRLRTMIDEVMNWVYNCINQFATRVMCENVKRISREGRKR